MAGPPRSAPRDWRSMLAAGRGRAGATLLAVLAALLLFAVPDPGPSPWLRGLSFDAYQRLWPRERHAQPAAIVAVDERSLAALGQWPWPRDQLATLVDRIAAREPAVIALDVVFAEADRTSPDALAQRLAPTSPELARQLARLPTHESLLAAAFAGRPVVLGVVGGREGTGADGFAPARLRGPAPPLQAFARGARSVPVLDAAASGRGLLNATLEEGVVRQVPLVANVAGHPLLSLPLECLRVAAGEPVFGLASDGGGLRAVHIGDLAIPAQADGTLYVHYSGHDPGRYVSALDVMRGRDPPDALAGRVVLVGVTGQGLVDQQLLPNRDVVPGVEVHAEILENVFEGALLQRPREARALEALAFALLAALAIAGLPRLPPRLAIPAALGGVALLLAVGAGAYHAGRLHDALTPALALAGVQALLVLGSLVRLDRARRELAADLQRQREHAARMAGEFAAATRVQTGMLPRAAQVLGSDTRLDLFAHMRPAREVGGDLYDFFYLGRRRLFCAVGDVAGKGLGAALFMAVSKALTKSASLRGTGHLGELLEAVNIELARDNPEELFVTLLAVVVDLDSGRMEYCNAGHEPLRLVRADGTVELLDEGGGAPLCVFEYTRYASAVRMLAPGDWLALVSDGLTEAAAPDGRLFGRAALDALLAKVPAASAGGDAERAGQSVLRGIADFEAGAELGDDQTLLLLRWQGPAAP